MLTPLPFKIIMIKNGERKKYHGRKKEKGSEKNCQEDCEEGCEKEKAISFFSKPPRCGGFVLCASGVFKSALLIYNGSIINI